MIGLAPNDGSSVLNIEGCFPNSHSEKLGRSCHMFPWRKHETPCDASKSQTGLLRLKDSFRLACTFRLHAALLVSKTNQKSSTTSPMRYPARSYLTKMVSIGFTPNSLEITEYVKFPTLPPESDEDPGFACRSKNTKYILHSQLSLYNAIGPDSFREYWSIPQERRWSFIRFRRPLK